MLRVRLKADGRIVELLPDGSEKTIDHSDPAEFVRLHRSTLARRDRIVGFKHNGAGAWQAQLRDGRWLRVGRTYLANARAMAGTA